MIALLSPMLRARRARHTAPLAALLLVLQGAAPGVTGLLHAAEALTAPAAIESEHGNTCRVIHDPARCATCQVVGAARVPETSRGTPAATGALSAAAPAERPPFARTPARPGAPPRAPPVPSR